MGELAWIGLGLAAALAAAGVTLFAKLGLEGVDTTLATTLRSLVMSGLLVAFAIASGSARGLFDGASRLEGRAWSFIALAGLCGAASWLAYFAALRLGPAGPVAALDRLSLPLVFLLGVFVLAETPGAWGWTGLMLVVGGTAMIAFDSIGRGTG